MSLKRKLTQIARKFGWELNLDNIDAINNIMTADRWSNPHANVELGKMVPDTDNLMAGLLAYSDGTNWDGGQGAGFYYYTGTAWAKLFNSVTDNWFVGAGTGLPYGNCYGNAIADSINASVNTWYPISDADVVDGPLNLVTHDGNGKLTVTKAGQYLAIADISTELDTGNKHLKVTFLVNGAASSAIQAHEEFLTANVEQQIPISGILTLAANDTVEIGVMQVTGVVAVTILTDHMALTLVQIGG